MNGFWYLLSSDLDKDLTIYEFRNNNPLDLNSNDYFCLYVPESCLPLVDTKEITENQLRKNIGALKYNNNKIR